MQKKPLPFLIKMCKKQNYGNDILMVLLPERVQGLVFF